MTKEEYFCREYMEKLYYFCLKKTGSIEEAEDLSSEISVEILTALKRGAVPEQFHGWVWKIARNRYARWAERKHKKAEQEESMDREEYPEIADGTMLEERLVQDEEIQELRRELTLIEKEYRTLLVAYYVDNLRISDIAKNLSIPEGTVKKRLFTARQKLKEGMAMARTLGKLSYAPEEISFSVSGGSSAEGEPGIYLWNKMYEKICKNIMIEAYRNPVTIQEISMELGIAVPYLEGFVDAMTESTLLVRHENQTYETNFVIVSSEAYRKMNDKLAQIQKDLADTAKGYLERSRELQLAAGNEILGHYQDYEEQKWTLALRLADDIQWSIYDKRNLQFYYDTKRPNGGSWDIMGVQKYDGPSFSWIGHSVAGCEGHENVNFFVTSKQSEGGLDYVTHKNAELLHLILEGKAEQLSGRELEELLKYQMIRKNEDGKYEVAIGIYQKEHNSDTLRYGIPVAIYNQQLLPMWNHMLDLADEYIAYCEEVMREEVPERLMNQFNFCMHSVPFLRGAVADGLLERGFLKPEEELTEMMGVYTAL